MTSYDLTKLLAYNQRVKQILPGGVHYNFRLPWEETPIHFKRSQSSRLWDMDDNEYLDLYARFGALIVGHNNEEYNDCLKEMIGKTLSVSHCDIDAEALELIARHVPSAQMIRFGVSGTEIVQNALRLARAYTKKNRFIRFEGHYHGNADNIMGGKAPRKGLPVPTDFAGDLKGTEGRARQSLEDQSYVLPWNDAALLEHFVEENADDIAAIITEPICINGGGIMPLPGYLQAMRAVCDRHNIVLIFDEIITGFRVAMGGAQQLFGVTPDLTTLGKALGGGGVPVAALVGRRDIMQLLVEKRVVHAGTFNGYPLGTAAIKATLEILGRDNGAKLAAMNQTMNTINTILCDEARRNNIDLVVQGPAACASFHCCAQPIESARDYSYDLMFKDILLNNALSQCGILVSSVSRMYPNIQLRDDDVAYFRERVVDGVQAAARLFDEIYTTS